MPTDRRLIGSGTEWEAVAGYSRAVRVGRFVLVAGTTAGMEDGRPIGGDDAAAQTREALRKIGIALDEAGASLHDVVRTRMYVTDIARWEAVAAVHGEVFSEIRPASTLVEVSALVEPGLLVEIEADAIVGD